MGNGDESVAKVQADLLSPALFFTFTIPLAMLFAPAG